MEELSPTTVAGSELVEQTFNFWFKDNDHIRSPFPITIQPVLKQKTVKRFFEWTSGLNEKASEEMDDTMIGEKMEEILFETALGLVKTEDEKITINYPFMPRIGDEITHREDEQEEEGRSVVRDRSIEKEGDQLFLAVKLEKQSSKEKWETKFELPA